MEVKAKAIESKKIATKAEDEKKTKKGDLITTNCQEITIIKGHLKIIEGFRQAKTRDHDQSPKSSRSSSSSYVMKVKMGNYKNSIQRSENIIKMENHDKNKKVMNLKQNTEESNVHNHKRKINKKVWDCESTLYDSFELNSFNRQLDSAISSSARSMSMPHHLRSPPPSETTSSSSSTTKKQSSNKISRSLQKLIKSIFRQKQSTTPFKACDRHGVDMDKYYVVFDKTGSLTTIPESGESTELVGSEINNSLVRKTVSERFPPSRLAGISCS
ncbi:unnamed protein product [Microthlaspi erraticum]|uniref:Uncharacterized protein n=1 Tax=Microthlaspi erraticum TaxID=1685480 RepID=A0A6D2JLB1_9BRAS|nr:unnamed protein product [Microthlaspi erraticum]